MKRWRPPEVWTASQRTVLIALLGCLLIYLVVRQLLNPVYVSDPQPTRPPRYEDLADQIDPNTTDWQSLAALPGLGEKRAKTIISYREAFVAKNPGHLAFDEPEDLLLVRGIGPSMLATLRPYLLFPEKEPATDAIAVPASKPSG